jgi:hypothetical protein
MRLFRLGAVLLVFLAAACGSDKKDSEPPTTTVSTSTSSSTVAPATTTTTSAPASTTTTTAAAATVVIESLTGPPNPVACDAPTMEELDWKTRGATKVELFAGTQRLGQYPGGAGSEIVPLKCDGSSRTYTLKATKGSETVQRTITLTTKPS